MKKETNSINRMILKKYKIETILIIFLYAIIAALFLKDILFSSGVISGGDWGFPATVIQINEYFKKAFTFWTNNGNLFGARQSFLTLVPIQLLAKIFITIGMGGGIYEKMFLLFVLTFASYSFYSLSRFFKFGKFISILAGVIYTTTPLFFNYSIMGWQFVLLAMGLLPLAIKYFIRAVQENKINYAIIAGIIYAISIMQSQSAFWFMIVFIFLGFYLINDRRSGFTYFKTLTAVAGICIFLNSHWILGLLIIVDKGVSGSDIVNSEISLGTLLKFHPINIIRLFGSLYNFQYETVINKSNYLFLSFFLPLLAFCSLFLKQNKKLIISFWLIGLVPILMYILNFNRDILLKIPFSNVIRDFSRFTVLSTFAYTMLALFFLNFLLGAKTKTLKCFGFILIFIWFLSIFPWWTGELTNWKDSVGSDMRLRTKIFPGEYIELENDLVKKKLDQKAIYLPIGGTSDFEDDPKFQGIYHGAQDIFAGNSPVPGVLLSNDRNLGHIGEYVNVIKSNLGKNLVKILNATNIKYFVIRKNMLMENKEKIISNFDDQANKQELNKYWEKETAVVYSKNDFLPHFYTPSQLYISFNAASALPEIISTPYYIPRSAIYFTTQNPNIPSQTLNQSDISSFLFTKTNKTNNFVLSKTQAARKFILGRSDNFNSYLNIKYSSEKNKALISSLPANKIYINDNFINEKYIYDEIDARLGDILKIGTSYINVRQELNENIKFQNDSMEIEIYRAKMPIEAELFNNSFENGLWEKEPYDCSNSIAGDAQLSMSLSADATEGKNSLELGSKNHYACAFIQLPVKLSSDEIYKYSFDYKNVKGKNAQYYYQLIGKEKSNQHLESIKATNQNWNHYETFIESEEDINAIDLYFYSPSDGTKEVVNRFDNIRLEKLELADSYVFETKDAIAQEDFKLKEGGNKIEYINDQAGINLIANNSFENGLWEKEPYDCSNSIAGDAQLSMSLSADATEGKNSLELGSKNHYACAFIQLPVKLSSDEIYKYSFDYKNVKGKNAQYYYQLIGKEKSNQHLESIKATNQNWNHYETFIESEEDINAIDLYFYSPSDGTKEVVNRFDNIKIEEWMPKDLFYYYLYSPAKEQIKTPFIEFKKINPTKYRIRIHQATGSFPLVFSESFYEGWKAYPIKPDNFKAGISNLNYQLSNYKILDGNIDDQATKDELVDYINKGLVSDLGDGKEKYNIDFISKNFQDTIQNDNLPNGHFYETYFQKPLEENNHLMANGYANSWWIDINKIKNSGKYIQNPDGSIDFEMVVEFWPQRWFYSGLIISGLALISCISYLIYDTSKKCRKK